VGQIGEKGKGLIDANLPSGFAAKEKNALNRTDKLPMTKPKILIVEHDEGRICESASQLGYSHCDYPQKRRSVTEAHIRKKKGNASGHAH